jgi:hypothetical protein
LIIQRFYEEIAYPTEDPGDILEWNTSHAGITARILVNPTMAEVRYEAKLYEDSNGTDLDAQDAYWKGIADRITEWNLQAVDAKGKPIDIPPPSEDWTVLLALPFDVAMWLRQSVHWAHRGKVLTLLQGRAGTTDTTPPTPIARAS